jgi:hypothetical protein
MHIFRLSETFNFSLLIECPHNSIKSLLIYSIYKQPPALSSKLVWFLCISLLYHTLEWVCNDKWHYSFKEHAFMWRYLRIITRRLHCSHIITCHWPWPGLIIHFGPQQCTPFSCIRKLLSPFSPLNAQLTPICHLLSLLGAHHILHVTRIRVRDRSTTKNCYCS